MIRLTPKEPSKGLKKTPMKRKPFKRKPPTNRIKSPKKIGSVSLRKIKNTVAKNPPKKRKTPRLDPLDVLFSEFIRRRAIKRCGGCERCLTPKFDITKDDGANFPAWKSLQCSHFYGRTDQSTRFEIDNAIGACGSCHMFLEHHPHYHDQWFQQHLGKESFEMLEGRNRNKEKFDRKLIELHLKNEIAKLEKEI
jgi:hypothetical protein